MKKILKKIKNIFIKQSSVTDNDVITGTLDCDDER